MKEMRCKVCGYVGQETETDCPECGAPLHAVETAPAAPVEEEAAPPSRKVYIIQKLWSEKGRAVRWAAGFLAVCLLLQGAGLWLLHRGDGGMFLKTGENWHEGWDGGMLTPEGYFPLGQFCYVQSGSIGAAAVIMDYSGYLSSAYPAFNAVYYYNGHTIESTDWLTGYLSGDGRTLFFIRQEGEERILYRRDVERSWTQELLRTKEELTLGRMATDGSAVLCYTGTRETDGWMGSWKTWLWSRASGVKAVETWEIENENEYEYVMWLGRDGTNRVSHHYSLLSSDLVDQGGMKTVVDWGRRGERTELQDVGSGIAVDRDLTQILYRDGEGRWRYEDETGRTGEIIGLEGVENLSALTPNIQGATLGMARLTPWVYEGSDRHLYCIGDDLQAVDLTPEGKVSQAYIHPEGEELYYIAQGGKLFHIQHPLKGGRMTTPMGDANVAELSVSADLSVCVGKTVGSSGGLGWNVITRQGEYIPLEHAAKNGWVSCVNGGCWYESEDHALWFWSEATGEQKAMEPWSNAMVISVGDGDQAILRRTSDRETADYWLLDNKGKATKLEVREDGIEGAYDPGSTDGYRYGGGRVLNLRTTPRRV